MLRGWVRWVLFASSYAPLLALVMVRNDTITVRAVAGCLLVLSVSVLIVVLKLSRSDQRWTLHVTSVRSSGEASLAYLLAYVLPFIGGNFTSLGSLLSVAIFGVVIGSIYVRTDLLCINPILFVAGYGIFAVEVENGSAVIISRDDPGIGPVTVSRLHGRIYLGVSEPARS